jgi:type II secretory pathway pseudopilin PulG
MQSINQNNDAGYTLVELLVSMAITMILGVAVLTFFAGFYADGQETSALARRISNTAVMESIGNHFLARANYNGQSVAATLSVPAIINNNEGANIQWMPYVAGTSSKPVICTGTLVDKTLDQTPGVQVNGVEWVAGTAMGSPGYCGSGSVFFPTNNQWGFTLVQRSGCPNPTRSPNALLIASNYDYGTTKLPGISGSPNTQVVTVCLPNLT